MDRSRNPGHRLAATTTRRGLLALVLGVGLTVGATRCVRDSMGTTATCSPAGEGPGSRDRPPLRPAGLGTNLGGVVDWTDQDPFLDAFKQSRRFVGGTADAWNDGRELALDGRHELLRLEAGQIARTVMLTGQDRFPGGRYIMTYRGEAEMRFNRDVVEAEPGRLVLQVPAPAPGGVESALTIDVLSVDPEDPLREVHVYPPLAFCEDDQLRSCAADADCETGECVTFEEASLSGELFRPRFIASLAPYGMLRFMDYGHTNDSEVREWDDRVEPEDATYAHRGVPLERIIELSNRTGAQPWLCIPHMASDDYVRRFAALLKTDLDPSLPVWIEYSNELWNGVFSQAAYAQAQGEARGLGEGHEARSRFQGARSAEIFDIVDGVLGPERVVRVLAAQASWAELAELIIEGAEGRADALAIAPYVGMMPGPEEARSLVAAGDEALARRSLEERLPEALGWVRSHAAIARRHGLTLVAYEAGQHFIGVGGAEDDDALNALFDRFNRSPAMGRLYTAMLEGWVAEGGGWVNHFVDVGAVSKWGRWGALEYPGQPREEAPKYDALLRFVAAHPNGW